MLKLEIKLNEKQLAELLKMPEQAHRGIIQGLRMAGRYVEGRAKARF